MDILKEQAKLQKEVFHRDLSQLRHHMKEDEERAIFEMIIALQGELTEFCEAMKILPWKKRGLGESDYETALEELIDVHHFLNNLYLIMGLTTDEEVKEAYLKKLNKNRERGKIHEHDSHIH